MSEQEMIDLHSLLTSKDHHIKYWQDLAEEQSKRIEEARTPFICRECNRATPASHLEDNND